MWGHAAIFALHTRSSGGLRSWPSEDLIGLRDHGVDDQTIAVLHQRVDHEVQLAGRLAFAKQPAVWGDTGLVCLIAARLASEVTTIVIVLAKGAWRLTGWERIRASCPAASSSTLLPHPTPPWAHLAMVAGCAVCWSRARWVCWLRASARALVCCCAGQMRRGVTCAAPWPMHRAAGGGGCASVWPGAGLRQGWGAMRR